jgi:hypothetical protein
MPASAPAPDQRSSQRFGLALPITMEGEDCASHDLSATGLLLEAPSAPLVGATVDLTLEYEARGQACSLACQGQVVRVERLPRGYNIGVRLNEPLFAEDDAAAGTA